MKPIRKEVSWKFLDEYRGKFFKSNWPTLPEMVHISEVRYSLRPCFVDFEGMGGIKQTYTYAQVWKNIETLAQWMMANGIKKGDHIAVSGKNSPEWATVFIASMLAGGIAIPIDYALREAEIENLMNTAKPKMFFVDEEKLNYFSEKKNGVKIYSLSPKVPSLFVYNLQSEKETLPYPEVTDKDTAAILFTSGTTGIPKGVMLSHENLVSDSFIAQQNLVLYPQDVFYNLLPIHHAYTMQAALIVPLSTGSSIVFGKTMAVTRVLRELKEGEITVMLGVPLLYNKIYSGIKKHIAERGKATETFVNGTMGFCYGVRKITGKNIGRRVLHTILEKANFSTMRVAICGGGPLAPSVFKAYNALGIDFIQGYGLTETSPIIALNPLEHFKIESVGKDFSPYEEIKILNPNEQGIGEIAVKGPMVMQGYYNMPEETKAMFTEDGFLKTGDLGWLDKEHYLMLAGRAKNLIVTEGGKNVYPEEIEDAFQLYYDVEQIMVRGYIADESTKSEQIEALIYPSDDLIKRLGVERSDVLGNMKVYDEIELIVKKVNKTLQPYARISKITILDKLLEMTTTRKIKRNSVGSKLEVAEEKTVSKEKPVTAKTEVSKTTAQEKVVSEKLVEKPAAKKEAVAKESVDAEKTPAVESTEEKKAVGKKRGPAKKADSKEPAVAKKKAATKKSAEEKDSSEKTATKKAAAGTAKKSAAKKDSAEKPAKEKKAAAPKKTAKTKAALEDAAGEKPAAKKATAGTAKKASATKTAEKPAKESKTAATKKSAGTKKAAAEKTDEAGTKKPAKKATAASKTAGTEKKSAAKKTASKTKASNSEDKKTK